MEDLAQSILTFTKKLGPEYIEVRSEDSVTTNLISKNKTIHATSKDHSKGISVRFVINNKLGFFATNKLEKKHIKEQIAKHIKKTKALKHLAQEISYPQEKSYRKKYKEC